MKLVATGVEDFKEFLDYDYYYVDKTQFIETVLNEKVALFTRPRRFGKTLNMSMLYYFFSNKEASNAYLFNGLKIQQNKNALKHQNQYPVISITLKGLKDNNYKSALSMFKKIIRDVIDKYSCILTSDKIEESYKYTLNQLYYLQADEDDLKDCLRLISYCLEKHFSKKSIILIDEYDVPLQAAYDYGYYQEMINFISQLFSSTLKTNDSLEKAVLTGCLRIARESIFTGMNNFAVYSIFDETANDCFGFTQDEVDNILKYYHLEYKKDEIKEWYDGYNFGGLDIYNPWSTLRYIKDLNVNKHKDAESYWANTSSNDIVYNYIKNGNREMKDDFEVLSDGGTIIKKIKPELTYREMDDIDNIYSFLLFTGYLKIVKQTGDDEYELIIPNKEVKKIYISQFNEHFNYFNKTNKNHFISSLVNGDYIKANEILDELLFHSISYHDYNEAFYHGLIIGLIKDDVYSNQESGLGRYDIAYLPSAYKTGFIIECKISHSEDDLYQDSLKALQQIKDKQYVEGIKEKRNQNMKAYGISFYKKSCMITTVNEGED